MQNILIVEDDKTKIQEVKNHFNEKEHQILVVESAFFALKILSKNKFDLVVTNLKTAASGDFYRQVKKLSDASVICSKELGLIGTPSQFDGDSVQKRHSLRLVN